MSLRFPRRYWTLLNLFIVAAVSVQAQKPARITASFVDVENQGVTVRGYLAKPGAGSRFPAVLLAPATGLKGAVLETARDMATHGFVALAVDFDPGQVSHESDLVQSIGEEQLSARLTAAAEWLARQRPLVDPQRVGAIGFDGVSTRILKLAQQGQIHAGVLIENEGCTAPENLPKTPAARMLLVFGGCTKERGLAVKSSIDSGGVYRAALAPAWSEIYAFLSEIAAPSALPASSSLVVTISDIMRVINSDDGVRGKLARLLIMSPNSDVQWDQARSHAAVLVESCDWLAALRPAKGSIAGWRGRVADFRAATQTLLKFIENRDLPGAQQALAKLPQSCGGCHADYR